MAVKTATKFTAEELNSLKEIQQEMNNITIQFGQISVQRNNLDIQEKQLYTNLNNLRTKETKIAKELSDKYGKGTLDVESGEFTPEN